MAAIQKDYRKWMIENLKSNFRFELISMFSFGETVWEAATKLAEEKFTSTNIASDEIADYDCGIINDYGGGNVQWWQDYLRHEINRCNEYWRSATSHVA